MVAVAVEGAVVNIQTLGASCEGILASEDFLIYREHLAEMLAVFLTYRAVTLPISYLNKSSQYLPIFSFNNV